MCGGYVLAKWAYPTIENAGLKNQPARLEYMNIGAQPKTDEIYFISAARAQINVGRISIPSRV